MPDIRVQSEGSDNQNVGINYGLIQSVVLKPQRDQSQALRQLPADILDFVGRGNEITRLEAMLQNANQVAISAVSGMAGVGKSALAIHVAHRLAGQAKVQLYVNLQGSDPVLARQPQDVLCEWLSAFGVEDAQIATMSFEAHQQVYRSVLAERGGIVVLDNARDAAQVEPLLPGQGRCWVLITSRESLGLNGVKPLPLGVMEDREALQLLMQASGRSAFSADETGIANEVVRFCGRLPLALRISGAILSKRGHWGWETLANHLRHERDRLQKFAELHGVVKPASDLDVRSSFNVSYRLLEPSDQQVFAKICAIPGRDLGLGVVAALTEDENVASVLDRLVDMQLVEGMEPERYQLHDLVRLFGQEKLEPSHVRDLGQKAVQWYLAIADLADDALRGQLGVERETAMRFEPATPQQTRQRLLENSRGWFEMEWQNLKACVTWCELNQAWAEGCQMPLLMNDFAALRGYRAEMPALLRIALDSAQQSQVRLGEANTLKAIGDVLQFLKQSREALSRYDEALGIYRDVGDRLGEANTLKAIGDVLQFLKQSREALSRYDEALGIYRDVGDRLGEANTLKAIGECEPEPEKAMVLFQTALQIYRDIGDQYSQARILVVAIANAYLQLQQPEPAIHALQQARQIFLEIGFNQGVDVTDQMIQGLQPLPVKRSRPNFLRNRFFWLWFAIGLGVILMVWWLKRR